MPTKTGHESGFRRDGNTFWVAGGGGYIDAVDVSDPTQPKVLWSGAYYSHGLSLTDDGNTLYQTDPINGTLGILDVSQIQARMPDPFVPEIARVTWDTVSIPQNTDSADDPRQALPARVRRVRLPLQPGDDRRPGRRRAADRHQPTAKAPPRLEPAPRGQPARPARCR